MAQQKKVIKISPELDEAGAKKLNRDVKKQFSSGQVMDGVVSGFTRAGIAFAAAAGIGALMDSMNSLGESSSKIRTRLSSADELQTRAEFYGVSADRVGRLEDIASATGLNQADLYNAIDRFGNYIREAREKGAPNANTYSDNTFDAFLQFMDTAKNSDPRTRQAMLRDAIGRSGGKFADFVQSDWGAIEARLGDITTKAQWAAMAGTNDEMDLQNTLYSRKARNYLADSLGMRNYAIERNLITEIQNNFDTEIRDIATTWGREIKRTVGYATALGESLRTLKAVIDTYGTPGKTPSRHLPDWVGGMSPANGIRDNSSTVQQTKIVNQSKKGVSD